MGAPAATWSQPRTRAEAIDLARRDKQARLWPERESPLVGQVNDLVERGLYEGVESGKGANGPQIVLGGMRSGQGFSFGAGYRRSDIWNDRIGFRATARGTLQEALLFDFKLDFQGLRSERSFLEFYTKYERSPQMDYYGFGGESKQSDRSSYLLEDLSADFRAGFELFRNFRVGATAGALVTRTGRGRRGGLPSTGDVFDPSTTPGLGEDTWYTRAGLFFEFDDRDLPTGPRDGGYYAARIRQYVDQDLGRFDFGQIQAEVQQYFPYFNKTRVIAIRVVAELTFERPGQDIPFYLQPKLGGNESLRGFARYRFHDDSAILATVEHRWHAFSGLDMALFVDAGRVAPELNDVDFSDLEWNGGIGFRFKLQDAIFMRIDFAAGREGFRWMWTFSDIFNTDWFMY